MVDQWVWPVGEMQSTAVGDSGSVLLLLLLLWWCRLDCVRERFRFNVHFGVPAVPVSCR